MARGEPERCRAWSWSRFPREQQQPCVYACTQGAWAGQSWFPLAFPSPYFSALSLFTSFLLSATQIHHSFSKYLVSTYCIPGTLPEQSKMMPLVYIPVQRISNFGVIRLIWGSCQTIESDSGDLGWGQAPVFLLRSGIMLVQPAPDHILVGGSRLEHWFSSLAAHRNHLESFIKCWCLGLCPRVWFHHSGMALGFLKAPIVIIMNIQGWEPLF